MKKIVLFALLLALVFALCACGETVVKEIEKEVEVEVPTVPQEYTGYGELVEALEKGDYEAALAFIDRLEPEPEVPPIKEVQITTENFPDYFEYIELPEKGRYNQTDADGNITAVSMNSGYYLKPEYTVAKEKAWDCSLEVGLKYALHWFHNGECIETDLENATYEITGKNKDFNVMSADRMCTGQYVNWWENTEPFYYVLVGNTRLTDRHDSTCIIPEEDIELVSASGVLYLYE